MVNQINNAGTTSHPPGHQHRRCAQGNVHGRRSTRIHGTQLRRYQHINLGIPIKKSPTITPEKALHLSFLITDYWCTAKKVIQSDLKMSDVPSTLSRTSSKRSASEQPSRRRS